MKKRLSVKKLTIKESAKNNKQLRFFQISISKFIHPPPCPNHHLKPDYSDSWNLEKLITRNFPS